MYIWFQDHHVQGKELTGQKRLGGKLTGGIIIYAAVIAGWISTESILRSGVLYYI